MAYKAIVRPQLEYASCVWDPHQSTYIDNIEKVQRRAARWVCSDYSPLSSVTSMLDVLGSKTLEQRRSDARLAMLFKIVHEQVAILISSYVHHGWHSHSYSFRQIQATKNSLKYSFSPSQSYSGTDSLTTWYH